LHDIGKIAITDSILLKPGKLTYEEFEQIKKHTVFGEKIIAKMGEYAKNQELN
jgi:putative two-component system response regulator